VFGDEGITNNVLQWGNVMLRQYGKRRLAMYDDFTTAWLGYATDNGAYYYVRPHTALTPTPLHTLPQCMPLDSALC
jgi:hypothetical protein